MESSWIGEEPVEAISLGSNVLFLIADFCQNNLEGALS